MPSCARGSTQRGGRTDRTVVNGPDCLNVMMNDEASADNSAAYAFLYSYMTYEPAMEPNRLDVCPILLTQPENDSRTPQYLSDMFLKGSVRSVQ